MPVSGFRLFKLFGIEVFLHWSWLLVAMVEIQARKNSYSTVGWNIAEYLALFAIVTMHEFGHALACRSVGGRAERIVLWPLGGVAYVQPPQRPGAVLWSIAAGPLVNAVLIPVFFAAAFAMVALHVQNPNLEHFVETMGIINIALLIFNMLPIYPLDGGQILRAVLWFIIGQRRSLLVASAIGIVGAVGGLLLAIYFGEIWLMVMAGFAAMQSVNGFQRARAMGNLPPPTSRAGVQCPRCGVAPPAGAFWTCPCGRSFDVFQSRGTCPNCGGMFAMIPCPACQQASQPREWFEGPAPTPATSLPPIPPGPVSAPTDNP